MSSGHFVLTVDPYFIKDEAWFHLSGYINSQNTHYWSTDNARERLEVSLHDAKIGVWCAVSGQLVVGPTFFNNTVNSQVYGNGIVATIHSAADGGKM